MRVLLDTNILLWATSGTERLDGRTIQVIEDPANTVLFSAASIWEIAIKAGLQRAGFHFVPDDILSDAAKAGFQELPVRSAVAAQVARLPDHHRDPFDRFLVAQAMVESAILLTTDRILARYSQLVTVVPGKPS